MSDWFPVAHVRDAAVTFQSPLDLPLAWPARRAGRRLGRRAPSRRPSMFEQLRASFRAMLAAARSPDDRREVLADMKSSVVRARMGLDDLRTGIAEAERRLAAGRAELETIRRRRVMAEQIGDAETVSVAERFEALQVERVGVLERKLETQQAELALVEREVAEMTTDLRRAMDGVPLRDVTTGETPREAAAAASAIESGLDDMLDPDAALRGQIDALGQQQTRSAREADADARLAALKRKLGKET